MADRAGDSRCSKARASRAIHIKVAEHKPDLSKKYKFYQVPSRWLHELYPVDDIFAARPRASPKDNSASSWSTAPKDIYTRRGARRRRPGRAYRRVQPEVRRARVSRQVSRLVARRGDDRLAHARASTAQTAIDARIQTDPERFWDHYQAKILPRIYDHVMKVTENRPMPDKQPFHRDLDVEVWMSEPDFRIGVDEELVSSLESLHEDLYFVTLDFFDALGRTTTRRRLAAPGKIFPIIHPERRGQAGPGADAVRRQRVDQAAARGALHASRAARSPRRSAAISARSTRRAPQALRAVVRADGVSEIELRSKPKDDREAARAADALDALARLHAAGLFKTALSLDRVDRVARVDRAAATRARAASLRTTRACRRRRTSARPPAEADAAAGHVGSRHQPRRIGGDRRQAGRVSRKCTPTRPGGRIAAATSRSIEITLPAAGRAGVAGQADGAQADDLHHRPPARQRGVVDQPHPEAGASCSSTDPAYRDDPEEGERHPPSGGESRWRADGVRPAEADADAHAARGTLQRARHGRRRRRWVSPIRCCPRRWCAARVWQDWLPDIYLNPHGYPSHEWVQQFAGYVPPGFRTYWSTRGWYTSVSGLRDPRYPEHVDAVRRCARRSSARSTQRRRPRHEPASAGALSPLGVRLRAVRLQPGDLQGHGDLLQRSGDRRAARLAPRRRGGGGGGDGGGGGRFSMNAVAAGHVHLRRHRGARRNGAGRVARIW